MDLLGEIDDFEVDIEVSHDQANAFYVPREL